MARRYTGGLLSATEQATDSNSANGIFTLSDASALTATGNFPTGRWTPQRALRFRASATAYLNRTYGTPTNNKVWTWSAWVKRGSLSLSDANHLFMASPQDVGSNPTTYSRLIFETDNTLRLQSNNSAGEAFTSSALFRDPAAWYHIVLYMDAVNTTVRCYVNGSEITYASRTNPTNANTAINGSGNFHRMGLFRSAEPRPFDGYMADVNFIDGQALTPSAFGITDPQTGTWVPKRYTGTYGTNGFYLDFRDNSAATASTIGADRSGNGNNFTPTYISVTPGVTYDSMVDVPGIAAVSSQPDIGGVQRGNYCTLNPLQTGSYSTLQNGNLRTVGNTSTNSALSIGTMRVTSGKWYWEVTQGATVNSEVIGIVIKEMTGQTLINAEGIGSFGYGYGARYNGSTYGISGEYSGSSSAWSANDVIGIAVDMDNGAMYFSKNGTWMTSGNPLSGSAKTGAYAYWGPGPDRIMAPACGSYNTGYTDANFGQRPFAYTPPVGFKTLCTTNLPNPVIKRPTDHFDVKTYTGNGNTLTVGNTQKQTSAVTVNRSLRFRESASAYLIKTPNTTSNQKTFTISAWVKLAKTSSAKNYIYTTGSTGGIATNYLIFDIQAYGFSNSSNYIEFAAVQSNSTVCSITTTPRFDDTTQWQHVMLAVDTTQTVPSNRVKIYQNGKQITDLRASTFPSLNADIPFINNSSYAQYIGQIYTYGSYDGYMAEYNFIDGSQKSPTDFGQFDANNNWVPKRYTSTYGTNGFYLPMDTTASGFSGYYGEFNLTGTTQYISIPDSTNVQFGTGNFTQECYFNLTGPNPGTGAFYSIWGSYGGGIGHYLHINDAGQLTWGTNGAIYLTSLFAVPKYQWNHVAIVRSTSSLITMYINGRIAASMNSGNGDLVTGAEFRLGSLSSGYPRPFPGYISNYRFVKGTALYTADFVPPTSTLTAVSGTTVLLLTGASATTESASGITVTNTGTVTTKSGNVGSYVKAFNDTSGNNNHWTPIAMNLQPAVSKFTTAGTTTWTAPAGVTSVNYLVVAGGGGGGTDHGGGGGAGGFLQGKLDVTPGTSYTVTVGAGGAGATYSVATSVNGSNSVFASITATGGGGGGGQYVAQNGGSGGGARAYSPYNVFGTGTAGQGNNGGTSSSNETTHREGGGGGGAGAVGGNSNVGSGAGGAGGVGLVSYITNASVYYAGGGGGGCSVGYSPGAGGTGGGGAGITGSGTGNAGTANTGGGGGGGGGVASSPGGAGGSGIVILSYGLGGDSTYDSPTDVLDTTNNGNIGNYAVLGGRPAGNASYPWTLYDGNLRFTSSYAGPQSTLSMKTGKWYWETTNIAGTNTYNSRIGIINKEWATTNGTLIGDTATSYGYTADGSLGISGSYTSSWGSTYADGDIIGIAFDAGSGKLWFSKNGTWQASGDPAAGTSPATTVPNIYEYVAATGTGSAGGGYQASYNFGQQNFAYAPPTGFFGLSSKNLKDVGAYNLPDSFGNFVNTPDLVWIKNRTSSYNHILQDTVRGTGVYYDLATTPTAQTTAITAVQAFSPNGFQIGSIAGGNLVGNNIVSWAWNRGQTPGFDIVSYAGNAGTQVVPHNLGQTPAFMIIKAINSAVNSWGNPTVYHKSVGSSQYINLNTTAAAATGYNTAPWANTSPNSTNFTVTYQAGAGVNGNTDSFIAYLWAEVPGFSKFGSYLANGSTDGPFVYLGFRPRWIMVKSSSSVQDWKILDTARNPTNPTTSLLGANIASAEDTNAVYDFDILSNGFKVRNTYGYAGTSGATYIYAAFAETPFKYSNAR